MSSSSISGGLGSANDFDALMHQHNIEKLAGNDYSQKVDIGNGKEMTVTLHYSGEVTDISRLKSDMDRTTTKMRALALALDLGTDNGPNQLTINRVGRNEAPEEGVIAEYIDKHVVKGVDLARDFFQCIQDPTKQSEKQIYESKIALLHSVQEIFSRTVTPPASSSPTLSPVADNGSSSSSVLSIKAAPAPASSPALIATSVSISASPSDPTVTTSVTPVKYAENSINKLKETSARWQKKKLDYYLAIDRKLNASPVEGGFNLTSSTLANDLNTYVEGIRAEEVRLQKKYSETNEWLHNELVFAFKKLQVAYNGPNLLLEEKNELGREIRRLNGMLAQMNLSTSKQKIEEGKVVLLGAVVEKKLEIFLKFVAKSKELDPLNEGDRLPDDKKNLIQTEIKKLRDEKLELDMISSPEKLVKESSKILETLKGLKNSDDLLYSLDEAKKANEIGPALEAGKSHLNVALSSAMNWTPIYSAAILFSSEGRAYTSETILEPQNLDDKGRGIPSGLRENPDNKPTNLFKTTHNIYGDEGEIVSNQVSFRGGQLPSKKAAKEVIEVILKNSDVKALHINALLTPTSVYGTDKKLLADHNTNIREALNELSEDDFEDLKGIKENLMFTNLGVNEGAVGKVSIMGIPIPVRMGWHTSIGYTDTAIPSFNKILTELLDVLPGEWTNNKPFLNRLGAIVHVGLEMEEIWAKNDFASATDNQFKQAAYWKVMDMLLGITTYTDCKSGKDRTGEVESAAQYMYAEIMMKLADHRLAVKAQLDEGSMSEAEKKSILDVCGVLDDKNILVLRKGVSLESIILNKITDAKTALNQGNLMTQKGVEGNWFNAVKLNTSFIPVTTPLRDRIKTVEVSLPNMAPISSYDAATATSEQRQNEARNQRMNMIPSIEVTFVNTGYSGTKLEPHEDLALIKAGFNREYVIEQLTTRQVFNNSIAIDLLGLHEVDTKTREAFLKELMNACGIAEDVKKAVALTAVFVKIEDYKAHTHHPKADVPN